MNVLFQFFADSIFEENYPLFSKNPTPTVRKMTRVIVVSISATTVFNLMQLRFKAETVSHQKKPGKVSALIQNNFWLRNNCGRLLSFTESKVVYFSLF